MTQIDLNGCVSTIFSDVDAFFQKFQELEIIQTIRSLVTEVWQRVIEASGWVYKHISDIPNQLRLTLQANQKNLSEVIYGVATDVLALLFPIAQEFPEDILTYLRNTWRPSISEDDKEDVIQHTLPLISASTPLHRTCKVLQFIKGLNIDDRPDIVTFLLGIESEAERHKIMNYILYIEKPERAEIFKYVILLPSEMIRGWEYRFIKLVQEIDKNDRENVFSHVLPQLTDSTTASETYDRIKMSSTDVH